MQRTPGSQLPALRLLITAVAVLASFPLSVLAPVSPMLSPHRATAAASFTVNSTADAVDASPGDGVCAAAGGACTLRAAIQEANALAGADVITLPAGTYTLSIAGTGEDAAATGDLDIASDVTLTGAGAATTFIQACDSSGGPCTPIERVLHIVSGVVNISGVTVRNGRAEQGGGIFNGGALTVASSTISGNTAPSGGSFSGGIGGGISNGGGGTVTINNSTISGNTAGSSSFSGGRGGGISNGGGGTVTINNSTISGNTGGGALFSGGIGGILNGEGGTLTINNSTISGNTGGAGAPGDIGTGGIYNGIGSTATLVNTILAGNTGDLIFDCRGVLIATGPNLVGDTSNCTIFGTPPITDDPMLGPLQDNGGPTFTHALPFDSSAVDAGDPAGCTDAAGNPLTTDQRGFPRPVDGDLDGEPVCDLGAYEASAPVVCTLTQEASFADGNMTMSYTLGTLTPVTWQVYLIRGEEVTLAASGPLEEIDPPFATGPLTFPVPALGPVVWFTALVDPSSTVLCWDSDQVDTGTPAAGGAPQALPAIQVPLPNGLLARP